MNKLEKLCRELEHFETPEWAARAILNKELMTRDVLDPCAGGGVLSRVATEAGYEVFSSDVHQWDFPLDHVVDFLKWQHGLNGLEEYTVYMNPPFSLAEEFVTHALKLGARKIVCFQRFSWWESQNRREFWEQHRPARVYVCGDRATCWRHDIPAAGRIDTNGQEKTTPTAHAWFIWEKGAPAGTLLSHIYKDKKQDAS